MSYKLWVMNVNRPKFIHADFITHITTASVCTEYPFQMIRLFQLSQHILLLLYGNQQIALPAGRTFLFNVPHAVFQIEVNTIETHFRVRIDHTFRNIRIDPFQPNVYLISQPSTVG